MESSGARRTGAALLAVVAVALLLPIVALASRPEGAAGGVLLSADPIRVMLDTATYLFAVLVVLSLLVIVWALWPRKGEEVMLPARRRRPLVTAITMLAMTLLAIAVSLGLRAHRGTLPNLNPAGVPGRLPASNLGPALQRGGQAGIDWIALAIVGVVLIAGGILLWRLLRLRASTRPLARLREVLDEAIEDAAHETDPRRAVIQAWTRLERVLARHGLPRRVAEAPFEYAARAGTELGVEARWLERLAGLFEWARFSLHEVTPAMREQAIGDLVAVRDGLSAST